MKTFIGKWFYCIFVGSREISVYTYMFSAELVVYQNIVVYIISLIALVH